MYSATLLDSAGCEAGDIFDASSPDAGLFKKLRRRVARVAKKAGRSAFRVARSGGRLALKAAKNPYIQAAVATTVPGAAPTLAAYRAYNTAQQYRGLVSGLDDGPALASGIDVGPVVPRNLTPDGFAQILRLAPHLKSLSARILARAVRPLDAAGFSSTTSTAKYIVEPGDYPVKIAQKLTGNGNRWKELRAANPQKPVDPATGNFKTLNAGEQLNIPGSWWPEIIKRFPQMTSGSGNNTTTPPLTPPSLPPVPPASVPPVPVPPMPPLPVPPTPKPSTPQTPPAPPIVPGPAVSPPALQQGTILQSQLLLVGWARVHADVVSPQRWGESSADFTGVQDVRYTQALASYQTWANYTRREQLRTDGQLDQATYDSLANYAAQSLILPPNLPPIPTPGTPNTPPGLPTPSTPPGLPTPSTPPGLPTPSTPPPAEKKESGVGALLIPVALLGVSLLK